MEQVLIKLLDIIVAGVAMSTVARQEYELVRGKAQQLIDEKRNPTKEEWDALYKEIVDLNQQIQDS